jgi:hypothetical protein
MRLQTYLLELAMKKGTQIEYESNTPSGIEVKITLERVMFKMMMWRLIADNGARFVPDRKSANKINKIQGGKPFHYWAIYFSDEEGRMITISREKGVAIELFAAIEKIFRKFIQDKKPEAIKFSGSSESKFKLYTLLAKKITKGIKGEYFEEYGSFYFWKK